MDDGVQGKTIKDLILVKNPAEIGHVCEFMHADSFVMVNLYTSQNRLFNFVGQLRLELILAERNH